MKKIFLALGLGLTLVTSAFADDGTIAQLNSLATNIITPYLDDDSTANINFSSLGH